MSLIGQICEENIGTAEDLEVHFLVHMEEKPHICEICNNIFSDKTSLEVHHLIHQTEKIQISEMYNKESLQQNSLEVCFDQQDGKHDVSDISEEFFHQNSSQFPHFDEEKEKLHVSKIHNEDFLPNGHSKSCNHIDKDISHISEICNKGFTGNTGFQLHYLVHRKKNPYTCEICKTGFALEALFKMHLLLFHSNLTPEKYIKGFSDSDSPKSDHGFQKTPHLSGIPNKKYKLNTPLKLQRLIQRKKKPIICEICKRRFLFEGHFKLHLFRFHTKEKL